MNSDNNLHRLSAFTDHPAGGNPAGIWIGERLPDAAQMQRIAAEVGYSETIFLAPRVGSVREVRYFSPAAEVSFCGHATIAAGVLLGEIDGPGRTNFLTRAGEVEVTTGLRDGRTWASLRSVPTRHEAAAHDLVDAALALVGWHHDELDPRIPPAKAYAGAWHLVLAAREKSRLDTLAYPFEALRSLMQQHQLTTLQLVWQEHPGQFHARNPFPVGGVVEDPATGAAAAAFGGYLRDAGLIAAPTTFTIEQGEAMGRPSRIDVEVPVAGGIVISGTAAAIAAEPATA
ncbi:PhzF family phenazine biosynthesis protein [Piscinibacter sakaiensis]|uniref:PhzF family phenazine biosynthesis protein n=1 Tax=Piscinibacter sakaiensis TaxID=1547922 RepID=UPI003AAE51E9